ncbi:flavin-binding monooxygenase [Pseudohyphozyma bogoriensis]|nr:flavin-binding monooxygenase [Pseudohyphozyma bogoriensis]
MGSLAIDPTTGAPVGITTSPFELEDYPIDSAHRNLKIAMIGSGFSGIIAGIRIDQRLRNVDLAIYEKNNSVGGTWLENHYPGLACDHNWSHFYAPGGEILQYLKDVASKYKLERFLRFRHKLVKAQWNDKTSQWHLSFELLNEQGEKIGEKEEVADAVIQGMGGLSRWDWPKIPGLENFKGEKIHSADYQGVAEDQAGKRVAVIGSGSSAIQLVPALQPHAQRVTNYGSTWIAEPFVSSKLKELQADGNNHKFSEEMKKQFADDKEAYHTFRHTMEAELNSVHGVTIKGSDFQNGAVAEFTKSMHRKLAKKPEILKTLVPTFPVACRRLTPGPGYLEALVEENVDFVPSGISRVTETGIETVDGDKREFDTIVCATGFDTSYRPRIPIIGRNGTNVQDEWADIPTHYLSVAIGADFPNYWVMNGPNSSLGSGSLLVLFEREADYIVSAIAKMQRENIKEMSIKKGAVEDFMEYIASYFPKTVYSQKCRSWYKKGLELGPVVALWPGSCLHAITALKNPRWEDYDYVSSSKQKNRMGWLGNGWSVPEASGTGDSAFYLNEIDHPAIPQ